jgi:amino acid adenylation domain-containing protein
MIPQRFVMLEAMPLLPNGKIDRLALPAPFRSLPESKSIGDKPRNVIEELIVGIWKEILKVDPIGIHDGFFELGGHSLLAAQVVSRIREAIGQEITLAAIFEFSTVATLGRHLMKLVDANLGLQEPRIERARRDQDLLASYGQQRLWFLQQLTPDNPAYNISATIEIKGELNVEALSKSLSRITQRHEVLRTRFEVRGKDLVQIVEPVTGQMLAIIDLRALSQSEAIAKMRKIVGRETQREFDLERGPLMRAGLIVIGQNEHILFLVTHHIVFDGWSVDILMEELTTLYAAYSNGETDNLGELPIQYADYAVWQRSRLQGKKLEATLSYWRKQLAGVETLNLPTDRPRTAAPRWRGAHEPIELDRETLEKLNQISQMETTTLFMTLLTAFQALMQRYSGQVDITIGAPTAGRDRIEIERLIGFFVNTLALRTQVRQGASFADALRQVRRIVIDAQKYQDLPFEKLVEELQPERDLSHTPLFQVMFVFQNNPNESHEWPNLKVRSLNVGNATAKFDLMMELNGEGRELSGNMEYSADLFDASTIRRMIGHFRVLLKSINADINRPIGDLAMLTEAEQRQLTVEWNETRANYPRESCLQDLFVEQALRAPEAVAATCGEEHISYAELNRRANQLGHYLRGMGVGAESRVGICIDRSLELLVGVLGILKAGGGYVPIDSTYPKQRVAYILNDADVGIVLRQERTRGLFEGCGCKQVSLDGEAERILALSDLETPRETGAENLAYVLYTSGSAGRPKGVVVGHRAVVRLVKECGYVELGPSEVMLQYAPVTFDASTFEIWGSLLNGGKLVMMSPGGASLEELGRAIEESQVTTLWLTAGLFHQMVDRQKEALGGVRQLLAGGESVSAARVRSMVEGERENVVINGYGPTEATTFSCCEVMKKGSEPEWTTPIGRPVTNTRVYVLDERLKTAPIGVEGELYIAGDGLARGYENDAGQTGERFLANPYGRGERMYRSGDVVRYREDGRLEFIGRSDKQIKIRGHRVEPGEIEWALQEREDVKEAVVGVKEGRGGEKRMMCYVVGEDDVSEVELKEYLRSKLPAYMLPGMIVKVEEIPLTERGKIAWERLPSGESVREGAQEAIGPRNEIEEIVIRIWEEILGQERISINENFFELGGHSLLATQVISRIREVFDIEIKLRSLFEEPTVEGLARHIAQSRPGPRVENAPTIRRVSREQASPLSFAQQRLWFLHQLEPQGLAYNIPVAVRMWGDLKVDVLYLTLTEIVRRHESLRTTFSHSNGKPAQIISEPEPFNLSIIDLCDIEEFRREERMMKLAKEEARRPFDLEQGPVLRASLIRLSRQEHMLLFTLHHIVSDGWSMGVLVREISILYEAFLLGKPSPLPDLSIQYADFACWQREWMKGDALDEQLSYWRNQLWDSPPVLELPTDRPRPSAQTFEGAHQPFTLSNNLTEQIKALSWRQGVTLFMTLLAGCKILFHRYSGQEDILVGTPVANRKWREIEGLIGFFANMLVLRTRVNGEESVRRLLSQVKETTLDAYTYQDLPFEMLVEALQPERDLSRQPLFQAVLSLQNAPMPAFELTGLTFSPVQFDAEVSVFDMVFNLQESRQGLSGWAEYNATLFKSATVETMLKHYCRILEGMAANPDRAISDLPLLSEAEQRQILVEWNQTRRDYPSDSCVHHLFEAQVEATPDSVAIHFGDQHLTYRELNNRANKLARNLKKLSPRPGVGTCIYLDHSPEMIVSILGALKAGGSYIPLDLAYPPAKLEMILADANPEIIITKRHLEGALPILNSAVIQIDKDWETISGENADNPNASIQALDTAYIIYTSGSTGEPKGVMIKHRSLVNYVWWARRVYLKGERLAWALHSSLAFDLTVTSIYAPLISGGTIIIYDNYAGGASLESILQDGNVQALKLTPSHLSLIEGRDNRRSGIERLIVGGESFDADLAKKAAESFAGKVEIVNEYGPTEATVGCMYYKYDIERDDRASVSIGGPADNVRIYVLDEKLKPVPENAIGELYIAGDGLAIAYLNKSVLTASHFMPDPFHPAMRIYRTGDLVRRVDTGDLVYVGRRDEQVKYHGYRVELNEIRMEINKHPEVRDSVIAVRKDKHKQDVLVCYYVSRRELEASELRMHLRQSIIDATTPTIYVRMKRLPLTLNGKLDHRGLPDIEEIKGNRRKDYQGARTAVEEILADIWAEVLGCERVSIRDNFFELGGHSLLATQVVSRVRDALGVDIPLHRLFEAPTIEGLAEEIQKSQRALQFSASETIKPILDRDHPPLSFAQERLWFLDQLIPGSSFYNIPEALHFSGGIDVSILEKSFSKICERHETLRTVFTTIDGQPAQVIKRAGGFYLPLIDLQLLPEPQRAREASRIVNQEAQRPFDLTRGPLLRVALLQLNEQEHILIVVMHHIIADDWSMSVFKREMIQLYDGLSERKEPLLPKLEIQYADWAVWQKGWLKGEVLDAELNYWRDQLTGVEALAMPTDYPRPVMQSSRGAACRLAINSALTDRLRALSRREGATLFMTLLAGFKALLHRYTAQNDLVVGVPLANRNLVQIEGLIGFFVNIQALRVNLEGNPQLVEAIRREKNVALGAYAHQDLPFEKLVQELEPERDLSRNPIFQVLFQLLRRNKEEARVIGARLEEQEFNITTTRFDLEIHLWEDKEEISGYLIYSTDLFNSSTIERVRDHWVRMLEKMGNQEETRIWEVDLMSEAETRQILIEWNETRANYPRESCLQDLFVEQALRAPEAVAATCGEEHISYAELNRRANQLGHYLRGMGVGAESRVGICIDRSLELLVGVLGILKAGGGYVPIDSTYPKQRVAYILNDADVGIVLRQERTRGLFEGCGCKQVSLDGEAERILALSDLETPRETGAENLAYVLYTSGSAGRPKGVVVGHRAVVRLVKECGYVELGPSEVMLQYAPVTFDASTFEIWGSLLNGGKLVMMSPGGASLEELGRAIEESQVTTLWLTAGLFHQMVDRQKEALGGVRQLLAGGESVSAARVRSMVEGERENVVINGYGPTEATTFSCCEVMKKGSEPEWTTPIGRPVTNTRVYVLDERLKTAPIGVEGELYIAGDGLARGYENDAGQTGERFLANPYGRGERMYRSGDVVRYREDGRLEFIGRSDKQIKIRGHRVEPGEIEWALQEREDVKEAVVGVKEGRGGEKRMMCYVVGEDDVSEVELKEYLRSKLPAYMLPGMIVKVEEIPLTERGKIAWERLPSGESVREGAQEAIGPRNEIEEIVIRIWEEILGQERISINENFFELGGHSLLATQVISRIREKLQIELPLRSIFEAPTVASLSSAIAREQNDQKNAEFPSIQSAGRGDKGIDELLSKIGDLSEEEARLLLVNDQYIDGI